MALNVMAIKTVRSKETKNHKLHWHDKKEKFWSDDEMSRRREYDH